MDRRTDFATTNAALHYVALPKMWIADGEAVRALGMLHGDNAYAAPSYATTGHSHIHIL